LLPLFFPRGCLFRSCSSPTAKNGPIRINQLRIAISVNLFFLYSCKMMGGWGHASYPRSSVPRPYPLSFHIFAHSSALFCTWKNPNSHVFRRFRTLRPKTGGGYPIAECAVLILPHRQGPIAAKSAIWRFLEAPVIPNGSANGVALYEDCDYLGLFGSC